MGELCPRAVELSNPPTKLPLREHFAPMRLFFCGYHGQALAGCSRTNEAAASAAVAADITDGQTIAYISEAGAPAFPIRAFGWYEPSESSSTRGSGV